ncbi:hypothetical protein OPV22_026855 [Ensete ventricosum]|uniref:NAC domain-containing protein n=1 Tax=Ensete ventricosum TaxID=4639 RepID=A0AAV8PTP2_ENSVE|nr:hypothetical protein OPV22_026855 [Ensete ventricosum]
MEEKPRSTGYGVPRLPPGFRFHPTDEELVLQYLKRKVYSSPLPSSIIPDVDHSNYNPWDLPACGGRGCEEVKYFFGLREARNPNRSRRNQAAGSGFWKATGKEKPVTASRCNQVVGMKKVSVFHRGKPPTKTEWIMHEYRLAGPHATTTTPDSTHSSMAARWDWVVCRVFKKKRAAKTKIEMEEEDSRQESSCVTQLSDGSADGEEASSGSMS